MRPTSKNLKAVLCIILVGSFILFYATVNSVTAASKKRLGTKWKPIKIGTVMYYGFLPAWKVVEILASKKIFAATYLFPSAVERLEATAAGYLNVSYAGLTATTLLSAAGKDIVLLCSTDEGGVAFVGRKGIRSMKDLRGKTVGTTFGSIEHMHLLAELIESGVDPKDVNILNFGMPPDLPLALEKGKIDAYSSYEPLVQLSVKKYGHHIIMYPHRSPMGAIDSGVETTREFVKDYPDLAYEIVKAHVQAVIYYRNHPKEALEAAVKVFKIPSNVADESTKNVRLAYNINVNNLNALAKFMKDFGYIKRLPDWGKIIDDSFLKRAKKELGVN
jgi:ABC-type nitrate/sulfonate/bicarbonate transport system substrate-binding protein